MNTTKILFLAGPAGAGKSSFASKYLTSIGWVHLEIDQYSRGDRHPKDGITEHRLRDEWDRFYKSYDPEPLYKALLQRVDRSAGIVLSFPGNLVFSDQHIKAAANRFRIAYLYGHPAHCLRSFLNRERSKPGGLSQTHWDQNNQAVFGSLSCSIQHPFFVDAFNPDGSHRDPPKIYEDIFPNPAVASLK